MARRSPTDKHSYWGTFPVATDLPNVTGSPVQSSLLQPGDRSYVVTEQLLYVCADATLGAAVWAPIGLSGSNEALFFEWNGTDTSQFNTTPVYQSAGITAQSLSVVADPNIAGGQVLQISATKGASAVTEYVVWFANEALPTCAAIVNDGITYGNLRWNLGVTTGAGRWAGLVTHGYDLGANTILGVGHTIRMDADPGNTWAFRVDGAAGPSNAAATKATIARFMPTYVRVFGKLLADNWVSGNVPRYHLALRGFGSNGGGNGITWRQFDLPAWSTAPNWAGVAPINRWGLCVQIADVLAAGTTVSLNISDLRLWTW